MNRQGFQKVVVTGGTGLVGRRLIQSLDPDRFRVAVVSRTPDHADLPPGTQAFGWDHLPMVLEGADAIFHLAGENLADRRWTDARKRALRQSRLESTRRIVEALAWVAQKPMVMVSASAIGFYGPRDATPVDESTGPGEGFLADLCQSWEQTAEGVQEQGVRLVKLRLGVVLAPEGGALPLMMRPLKAFLGSCPGQGDQGFSWIHIDDLVRLMLESAWDLGCEGALNATAPGALSQKDFLQKLAHRLKRPLWPLPPGLTRLGLRWALGEMAESMLLQGAYVRPTRAQAQGFQFRYPDADAALADLT